MEAQVSQPPALSSSYLPENRRKTWAFGGSCVVTKPIPLAAPTHLTPCPVAHLGARGEPSCFWIWASKTRIQIRTLPIACSGTMSPELFNIFSKVEYLPPKLKAKY